jgi:hypothetical protein
MRRAAVAACAFVYCSGAAPAGEPQSVQLIVRNETGMTMKCVLVLAHFVTLEHAVTAGANISIVMQRDVVAGTLWLPRPDDGRPMMVENLLCGAADRWSETRGEVPLLPLRGDTPAQMVTICRPAERLACAAPTAGLTRAH